MPGPARRSTRTCAERPRNVTPVPYRCHSMRKAARSSPRSTKPCSEPLAGHLRGFPHRCESFPITAEGWSPSAGNLSDSPSFEPQTVGVTHLGEGQLIRQGSLNPEVCGSAQTHWYYRLRSHSRDLGGGRRPPRRARTSALASDLLFCWIGAPTIVGVFSSGYYLAQRL